jgi:hypothetical protein
MCNLEAVSHDTLLVAQTEGAARAFCRALDRFSSATQGNLGLKAWATTPWLPNLRLFGAGQPRAAVPTRERRPLLERHSTSSLAPATQASSAHVLRCWLDISKSRTPAATATLIESQRPRMGMRTVKSDASMRWPERPIFCGTGTD